MIGAMTKRLALFFAWLFLGCGADLPLPAAERQEPILGGTLDEGDPAVGIMLADDPSGGWLCSGTLISPTVYLTAAHCVRPATGATTMKVYFGTFYATAPPGDWAPVKEFHYNPQFDINNLPGGHDCAVLIFQNPVTTTTPKPYNHTTLSSDWIGRPARLVGYGLADPVAMTGAGTKRQLTTSVAGFGDAVLSIGRPGYTSCFGDSGGPLFSTVDGVETVIGITSYGGQVCDSVGQSTRVDLCRTWIDGFLPDSTPPTVSLLSPHDGDTVPSGFSVDFDAQDNLGVASIDLYANGQVVATSTAGPWTVAVPAGTLLAGPTAIKGIAKDAHGLTAESSTIMVTVKRLGDTPGDLGSACTTDAQCTDGFCGTSGGTRFCSRSCASNAPCPPSFTCETTAQFTQQCAPLKTGDSGGCSALPAARGGLGASLLLALAGAGAALGRAARRRRRR